VENVGEGGVELEDVDRLEGARVRVREARRGGKRRRIRHACLLRWRTTVWNTREDGGGGKRERGRERRGGREGGRKGGREGGREGGRDGGREVKYSIH
jgi:hypothetical protein